MFVPPTRSFPCFAMSSSSFPSLSFLRKFRHVAMPRDGNGLFRAVAKAYHQDEDMHLMLRKSLMEHIMEDKHVYAPLFFGPRSFDSALINGRQKGVWHPDLAPVVLTAIADFLCVTLEVYSYDGDSVQRVVYRPLEGAASSRVRLLLNRDHCDLLTA